MPNFDKIADYWDFYTYPWIPNKDFLNLLKRDYKGINNILILGSTRQFRFFYKTKKITIADLSLNMINKSSVGNTKEIIINRSWFDLKNEKYNLIIGDLVLLLFLLKDKKKLVNCLKTVLTNNGCILFRCVVKKDNNNEKNIKKLFNFLKTNKSIIEFFNFASFELVNGFGYSNKEISYALGLYSRKIGYIYNKIFGNLTPYNDGTNHCFSEKEFDNFSSKYNISILNKKEGTFITEYIIKI